MNAKCCDRCGVFYFEQDVKDLQEQPVLTPRPIGYESVSDPEYIRIMGVSFKLERNDGNIRLLSLCPRCYKDLLHWYSKM